MNRTDLIERAFSMPVTDPAYPPPPYHFRDREFLVITYRTDPAALARVVPEPLRPASDLVKYEFIRMPDSSGLGSYTESGQVIPVTLDGEAGGYTHAMYLDSLPGIIAGRELLGFPKVLAQPTLRVNHDCLLGTLDYHGVRVATATMAYKHQALDLDTVAQSLDAPGFLLKAIPHVDATPRVLELVRYRAQNIKVREAWAGPASLELHPHSRANVAALPVLEVVSAIHMLTDLTLATGEVVHDYLAR
jgi:acetoacetate decarboxylase